MLSTFLNSGFYKILNQYGISDKMIYNMTIFGKIDIFADQSSESKMAAIFDLIWRTNDHEPDDGNNFFRVLRI